MTTPTPTYFLINPDNGHVVFQTDKTSEFAAALAQWRHDLGYCDGLRKGWQAENSIGHGGLVVAKSYTGLKLAALDTDIYDAGVAMGYKHRPKRSILRYLQGQLHTAIPAYLNRLKVGKDLRAALAAANKTLQALRRQLRDERFVHLTDPVARSNYHPDRGGLDIP